MSNLAVLLFKDDPNQPSGMPGEWPSQVVELGEETKLPGPEWVLFTKEEYIAHVEENQAAYDQFIAPKKAQEIAEKSVAALVKNQSTRGQSLIQEISQAFINTPFETDDHFKVLQQILEPLQIGALNVAKARISVAPKDDFLDSEIQPGIKVRQLIITRLADSQS
jgi:hypothetical protein